MKTKLKSEEDKEIFIIPSKEKTSNEEKEIPMDLFISKINSEKQIFLLNKFSPKFRIAKEILEKIKSALNHNIKVIYCIGETKEEKEKRTFSI